MYVIDVAVSFYLKQKQDTALRRSLIHRGRKDFILR
jgi:hypothetical protein